jgi:hypothetical protein
LLTLEARPSGRHQYPSFATEGLASDTRSRTLLLARPKSLPGYSPESFGLVPPIDFYSCQTHDHTLDLPKPRHVIDGKPSRDRVTVSLARSHQPGFFRSGVALRSAFATPTATTARCGGFTPTSIVWTPYVVSQCQTTLGRWCCPATARNRSLANQLTRDATLSRRLPFRAASPASSRKVTGSAAPRVPSTAGPVYPKAVRRSLPRCQSPGHVAATKRLFLPQGQLH